MNRTVKKKNEHKKFLSGGGGDWITSSRVSRCLLSWLRLIDLRGVSSGGKTV